MQEIKSSEVRWEWIGEAWKLFTSKPGTWVGMVLTIFVLLIIAVLPFVSIIGGFGALIARGGEIGMAGIAGLGALTLLSILAFFILVLVGGAFLTAGLYRTAIKQARGGDISISDLFSGGDRFLPVLGYSLLLSVAFLSVGIILGSVESMIESLSGVLGIIGTVIDYVIAGSMFFALPQIVDRRAGVIEAISNSLNLTKRHWLMYALFAFVVYLLSIVGIFLCFVGILVTGHFAITTPAVAYRDVFGLVGARSYEQFPTPPPPPSYWSTSPQPELAAGPAPPPQAAIVCRNCGATLTRATNFCNQCGARLELG